MTPRSSDCLHDSFRDWNTVSAHRNVELVRRFARVPRRPDVRVSPADLNYDVPPDADLRQLASAQGIDVEAPWFRLPEQRQLRCGFFPLVTRLHSGALLAMWREASAHAYCSFGRTVAARSLDGGRNWSVPWVVDFRRPGAWDTGGPENLVQTSDGSLWLGAWARIPEPEPGTVGKQRPEMYVLRSHDEGRSWEQLPKLGDGFQFLCSPMLELSNGEFLWLGSVPDPTDEGVTSYTSLRRAVFILRQPGEPLTPGADLVELGGLRFERYGAMQLGGTNECHVTETTTPGHLVMLTRSAVSEHYEQSTSTDYGRTWSPPRRSDLWHTPIASQPLLITLGDGTLVAVHDERGNGRSLAVPSFDGGATWDFAHHQVVLDDPEFFLKDFSYPEVVDVGAGRLLVVFYNASHPEAEKNGIFATFLDRSLFRTTFGGVRLADVGSVRRSDTVAWWRFDEGTGDTAHDDTGRHYGVLHGPAWSDGRYGRALAFDGLDDHLRVTNCPSLWLGQELTIEAWIRAPHPEREQTIVSRLPHYWFGLNRRRVCLRRGGEDGIAEASCHGTTELAADRWQHVAVVVRETADSMRRVLFYVDGVLDAATDLERPPAATQAQALSDWRHTHGPTWQGCYTVPRAEPTRWAAREHLFIGSRHDRTAPFCGRIDELALHRAGLKARQLAASVTRYRHQDGEIRSAVIRRPSGGSWGRFTACDLVPEGTAISYAVLGPDGKLLRDQVTSGSDLADLRESAIRLQARLHSEVPGRTPTLWSWALQPAAAGS